MNTDPMLAIQLGIKVESQAKSSTVAALSPEELAKEEAERERQMQESMQVEIVSQVMRRLETTMDGFDKKQKFEFEKITNSLNDKFKNQVRSMQGSLQNLQKYIEEVHSQ